MKILILDDDPKRHEQFSRNFSHHELTSVQTAEQAIEALKENTFDAIFLDHDLGGKVFVDSHGEEATGYTVAKWMKEHLDRKPRSIYVHSLNPAGLQNIISLFPDAIPAPGLWTVQQ